MQDEERVRGEEERAQVAEEERRRTEEEKRKQDEMERPQAIVAISVHGGVEPLEPERKDKPLVPKALESAIDELISKNMDVVCRRVVEGGSGVF